MGVLKVWDGSDWRKVGCGGSAGAAFTDDFNRADSATLDNGWMVANGVSTFGISSNHAYVGAFPNDNSPAVRNLGTVGADVSAVVVAGSYSRGALVYAFDPVAYVGYAFLYWNNTVVQITATASTLVGSLLAAGPGATNRVVYDPVAGTHKSYDGSGTLLATLVDGSPLTASAHTWVGFSAAQNTAATGETLDSFAAVQVGTPVPSTTGRLRMQLPDLSWVVECCDGESGHPLKIEDPANPGTWITVACMRPV